MKQKSISITGATLWLSPTVHDSTNAMIASISDKIIDKAIASARGRSCDATSYRAVFSASASAEYASGTLGADLGTAVGEILTGSGGIPFVPSRANIEATTLFALGAVAWEGKTTCDVFLGSCENCGDAFTPARRDVKVRCGHVLFNMVNESFNNPGDIAGGYPYKGEWWGGNPFDIEATIMSTTPLSGEARTSGTVEPYIDECECNG